MKYIHLPVNELISSEESYGITEDQKNKFFKMYTQLSKRAKKFIGRKKNSDKIKENFSTLLISMENLLKLG